MDENKQRHEHCAFAKINDHGKCVAICHYNLDSQGEYDCIGNRNPVALRVLNDPEERVRGRKFKLP